MKYHLTLFMFLYCLFTMTTTVFSSQAPSSNNQSTNPQIIYSGKLTRAPETNNFSLQLSHTINNHTFDNIKTLEFTTKDTQIIANAYKGTIMSKADTILLSLTFRNRLNSKKTLTIDNIKTTPQILNIETNDLPATEVISGLNVLISNKKYKNIKAYVNTNNEFAKTSYKAIQANKLQSTFDPVLHQSDLYSFITITGIGLVCIGAIIYFAKTFSSQRLS